MLYHLVGLVEEHTMCIVGWQMGYTWDFDMIRCCMVHMVVWDLVKVIEVLMYMFLMCLY